MAKSTMFFATASDLEVLLRGVEEKMPLQSMQAGRFNSAQQPVFHSTRDIPELGIASSDASSLCTRFLVAQKGAQIIARELSSEPLFAFDQLKNPKTVIFNPGGLWRHEILIRGSVGTSSSDPDSLKLFNAFKGAFKKAFTIVRGNYVGPNALNLLNQGKRLTSAEQSPAEYDLLP